LTYIILLLVYKKPGTEFILESESLACKAAKTVGMRA